MIAPAPVAGRWMVALLAIVCLAHAVQLFTPLRLNHDAVRLLGMAWSAHTTGSYAVDGIVDQYPPGYPAMLRALLAVGLGRTVWLNALNLGWLAVAAAGWLWMASRQFRLPRKRTLAAILLPLLSWVLVKHAVIPLSDIPYLGLSTVALVLLQYFWLGATRQAWTAWIGALVVAVAAVEVRTVGVTLLGAVLLCPLFHPKLRDPVVALYVRHRELACLLGLTVAGLGAAAVYGLMHTQWFDTQFREPGSYFAQFLARHSGGGPGWGELLDYRLREIASLGLNLPVVALPATLAVVTAGGVIAGLLWAAWRCRRTHLPLTLYGGLMALLLAVWPYVDARFFLPLLPVASLLAVSAAPGAWPARWWLRVPAIAGLGAYLLLGLAALGYSMRLTLSGRGMAEHYSHDPYRLTYRHAFGLAPGVPPETADPDWLATLQRHEPLATDRPPAHPP